MFIIIHICYILTVHHILFNIYLGVKISKLNNSKNQISQVYRFLLLDLQVFQSESIFLTIMMSDKTLDLKMLT